MVVFGRECRGRDVRYEEWGLAGRRMPVRCVESEDFAQRIIRAWHALLGLFRLGLINQ